MSASYDYVKRQVHKGVRESTIAELVRFSALPPVPPLWSYPKEKRDFIEKTIYIMFYKATEGIGFGEVRRDCVNWYGSHKCTQKTFQQNVQVMRQSLMSWSEQIITLGDIDEWGDVGRVIPFNNEQVEVHLLADSTDFRTSGPPGKGGSTFHLFFLFIHF